MQPLPYFNPVIFDEDMEVERRSVALCGHEGFLLCSVNREPLSRKLFHDN